MTARARARHAGSSIGGLTRTSALWRTAVALAASGMLAMGAAPVSAEPVFSVATPAGGGPAQYDRVAVQRFGRAAADTVLILAPGKYSGAGALSLLARDLAARVPSLQVWTVDRREQGMEDNAVMAAGDAAQALEYYLHGASVDGRTFSPPPATDVGYMGRWGLARAVEDLRAVVRRARASGRRVLLGGYSLGASVAEAYACWDFGGRAGARDLAGLVLIDGGMLAGVDAPSVTEARARAREFMTAPRDDPFRQKMPWTLGVLTGVAGPAGARRSAGAVAAEHRPGSSGLPQDAVHTDQRDLPGRRPQTALPGRRSRGAPCRASGGRRGPAPMGGWRFHAGFATRGMGGPVAG